ncbi:hypothetical protein P43SY_001930 [Pythium insidiosum]|uniref:Rho-GAP domain-containing protein n=1 Tax=Pythium insidiosum TaxID=114742 RepID=A0AAD5LS65_PYTIN|nr:hypothetical protein P43SY_001930 [Pythium insidiosum]
MDALFNPALFSRLGAMLRGEPEPESDEAKQLRLRQHSELELLAKSQRSVILEDMEHALQALERFLAAAERRGAGRHRSTTSGSSSSSSSSGPRRSLSRYEDESKQDEPGDGACAGAEGVATVEPRPQSQPQCGAVLMESTDDCKQLLLNDDVAVVNQVCAALDRCVTHGLRAVESDESDTVKFFGVVKWTCTRVAALRQQQMRDALQQHAADTRKVCEVVTSSVEPDLPRAVRGFLAAARAAAGLTSVRSDEGKARAFVRQALNMHVLHASMSLVLSETNLDLLASYYTEFALFRQRDDVKIFLHLVAALDELAFAFRIDDPRLDEPPEALPFSRPLPRPKAQKIKRQAPKLIDPEDMVSGRVRLCASDAETALLADKLVAHHELRRAFDSLKGGNPLSETLERAARTQKLEDAAVAVLRFLELGYPEYDVFGTELLDVLCNPFLSGMARFDTALGLPDVVEACLCLLFEHLDLPGLFQVHLPAEHALELRDTIEELGGIHKHMAVDPHEVSAVLYQYLWELPDSLLTEERLANFLACAGGGVGANDDDGMSHDERRMLLKVLVNDLPWPSKPLLERLCHLVHAALEPAHAAQNGLTLYAVANTFAPLLLRKRHAQRLHEYDDPARRKYPVGAQQASSVRLRLLASDELYPFESERARVAAETRALRHASRDAQESARVLALLFQEHEYVLQDVRQEMAERRATLHDKVLRLESLRFKMEEPVDVGNPVHVALLKRLWDALLRPKTRAARWQLEGEDATTQGQQHKAEEGGDAHGEADDGDEGEDEEEEEEEEEPVVVQDALTGATAVDVDALLRSRRWRRSGFHTANPLGGFRGGGLLALECLVFFLEEYPDKAQRMMARNALAGGNRYPFPVAAINVMRMLMKLLMLDEAPEVGSKLVLHATRPDAPATVLKLRVAERVSRTPFWHLLDDAQAFAKLHAMAFMLLDLHWVHSGATQMGFQPVLDATRRQMGWLLEQAPQRVEDMWAKWMEVREQHAAKYTPAYAHAPRATTSSESDALVAELQRKAKAEALSPPAPATDVALAY